MCTARLFSQAVDVFALKFYLDRVIPIIHSSRQKTRDTGLPDGEDRILLRSLILTQCWSAMDRQTDRRMDGYAIAYTVLAKLALQCTVKQLCTCRRIRTAVFLSAFTRWRLLPVTT